jgi:hypothetical protein
LRGLNLMFGAAVLLAPPLLSQVKEQEKFTIRIVEVERTGHSCTVKATSDRASYQLTSDVSAACAMLEAGKDYKAYRAISANNPKEENDDSAVLIVFNNVENKRRPNAVYDIASEKVLTVKPCPGKDPLGLYASEPCQPLPPQKKN